MCPLRVNPSVGEPVVSRERRGRARRPLLGNQSPREPENLPKSGVETRRQSATPPLITKGDLGTEGLPAAGIGVGIPKVGIRELDCRQRRFELCPADTASATNPLYLQGILHFQTGSTRAERMQTVCKGARNTLRFNGQECPPFLPFPMRSPASYVGRHGAFEGRVG
jgi:hypothetical protein